MWVGPEDVCLCGHHILTHVCEAYKCRDCICSRYRKDPKISPTSGTCTNCNLESNDGTRVRVTLGTDLLRVGERTFTTDFDRFMCEECAHCIAFSDFERLAARSHIRPYRYHQETRRDPSRHTLSEL